VAGRREVMIVDGKVLLIVLALAVVLLATPYIGTAHADVKVYASTVIRGYGYVPGVSTPFGVFDVEQYSTMHITEWATKDGGSRVLISGVVNVRFLESGVVVGQGTAHSIVNMIDPVMGTVVNQLDILVTFRGSGKVVSYHLTMVYVDGELRVFHEVGVP